MTTPRDPDRLIRAFLGEGQTELPDRTYDAVRAEIDRTRRRVVIGSWKPRMNTLAKLAIAAVAVVVVAVVGINLLPAGDGRVGSPTVPPSPQHSSSPSPFAAYPREGGPGRHSVTVDGVPLSFDIPTAGWESREVYLSKSTKGSQGAEAIVFWASFPGGWISPSEHTGKYIPCIDVLGSPEGASVADLAGAVSTVAGTDLVSGPADVFVGGRAAKHVTLFVTYSALDNGRVCGPGFFYSWEADTQVGAFWTDTIPGDTIRVWIVDVDGTLLFIEAATHWHAGPDVEREIQQVVDSIQFE